MDGNQARVRLLQALDRRFATVRTAVIHDPEDPPGFGIRWGPHDLIDQIPERFDSRAWLATTEQLCSMHIQSGQVGPRAAASVLMLNTHRSAWLRRQSPMAPEPGLNAGLLIGREHELIIGQWVPLPYALVEVKNSPCLGGEFQIAREYPASMLPRANSILMEPTPDGCVPDTGDQSGFARLSSDVTAAEAGEWKTALHWQFTGQRLDLDDHFWGGKPWGDQGEDVLLTLPDVVQKSACATCSLHPALDAETQRSHRCASPPPHGGSFEHEEL